MPTQYPDLFAALAAPFEDWEVKTRTQGGKTLRYVTARTVANRLDNVMGPENWWNACEPHENSVQVALTIRLPDGTTLTKVDAGGYAGMADAGDDDMSGYSNGLKRAAALFGVARYLYRDGVPSFVRDRHPEQPEPPQTTPDDGRRSVNEQFRPQQSHSQDRPQGERKQNDGAPRTGKALFAWVRDQEQRREIEMLKHLNSYAKAQNLPGRMVDYTPEDVELVYAEACRKLDSLA